VLIALLAFAVAAAGAYAASRVLVAVVEERSVAAVQGALADDDQPWVRVLGDGLQVILEGRAPTEAVRFRAMSLAGGMVDASRVIDNMSVQAVQAIAAPDFAIEILRNDSGVSLIGLIPADTDRVALGAEIARMADGQAVTDLLETADYPVPADWRPAVTFAVRALGLLPRSKISVAAGQVNITAISDSLSDKRRLETELTRSVPAGLRLGLTISAPRPVITPFTLRFVIDSRGARFDACAADTPGAESQIIAAAIAAGASGQISCTLALGVPTTTWGAAVPQAIAALAEIGGGTLTFSDADIVLVAAEGTPQAVFDRAVGALSNALPDIYALQAVLPVPPQASAEGPPVFTAALDEDGRADLSGRIADALMNETAENFARARFGADAVTMATRIAAEGLPPGWSVRVLAGIEALSMLAHGRVEVTPDRVSVQGLTGDPAARETISRMLIDKLGQTADFTIDVTYDEALDPIAGLPTPQECLVRIAAATATDKITFDPGSAIISSDALPVIDRVAEILRLCANLSLRIAGHTDSQGRDETNLRLSQQRAETVLDALRARRVPVASFEAVGFGESTPIADNGTDAGREANRRIEFSLIGIDPSPEAMAAQAAGVWPDAPGPLAPGAGTGGPERPAFRLRARPDSLVPVATVRLVSPEGAGATAAETAEPQAPAAETPVTDVPAAETPVAETPVAETPVAETPVPDVPVPDAPVPDVPVPDVPVPDVPVTDAPVADLPVTETPAGEAASTESQAAATAPTDALPAEAAPDRAPLVGATLDAAPLDRSASATPAPDGSPPDVAPVALAPVGKPGNDGE